MGLLAFIHRFLYCLRASLLDVKDLDTAAPGVEPGTPPPAVTAPDQPAPSGVSSSEPGQLLPAAPQTIVQPVVPEVPSVPLTVQLMATEPPGAGDEGFQTALPVVPAGRQVGALGRVASLAVEPPVDQSPDQSSDQHPAQRREENQEVSRLGRLASALGDAPEGSPLKEQLPAVIEELGLSAQMAEAMARRSSQGAAPAPRVQVKSAPSNGKMGSWDAGRSPWFTGRWRTN